MLEESGNLSLGGLLLAILSIYLVGGRLIRMYLFEESGRSILRPRPVVQVVVLGDIGRSPRIRNHAVSLADAACQVDLIGYCETPPGSRVKMHRHIRIRPLRPAWSVPKGFPKAVYLAWAPFKAVFMALQLFWIMCCISQYPDFILIQNPPSIPTLAIARVVSFIRRAWLIIDWHNFGYSILGMRLGAQHPVVRAAKAYEQWLGKQAYAHLTVTDAMRHELESWHVKGKMVTFHDRPPSHFKRLKVDEIHKFLRTSDLEAMVRREVLDADAFLGKIPPGGTLLTDAQGQWRADRPRLLVSSTSWTEDEDFSVLLDAVALYDRRAKASDPNLLLVITGKGPLRQRYVETISAMTLRKARVVTVWLEANAYPLLLGSADLGISLHTSSSGLDLPMKIVDMFGCGLPVCAIDFSCLHELVQPEVNGLVFSTAEQLADQWTELFVADPTRLDQMRASVMKEYASKTWEQEWKDVVFELFPSAE